MSSVIRATFDQLLDGQRTGRWDWLTLRKTEKTHMGTLVEINMQREFDLSDGTKLDYEIAGADVDCKFSQTLGSWMLPPESVGHLCLLVWAWDDLSEWSAGILRIRESYLQGGNRDKKRSLTRTGKARIHWLWRDLPLPENLLLHLAEPTREAILGAVAGRGDQHGQARVDALFRFVQRRLVPRTAVVTAGMQPDAPKRVRDARKRLAPEGIVILGHQESDPRIAASLALPVPNKGQFVSVRLAPADPSTRARTVELGGMRWRVARSSDPVVPAPPLPRGLKL